MKKQMFKVDNLLPVILEEKTDYAKTPVTDDVYKIVSDLSINVSTKFMWLYWAYEYLEEVSDTLLKLVKKGNISYNNLLSKSITEIIDIKDGKHQIQIGDEIIENKEMMVAFLNKYEVLYDKNSPVVITLRVRLIDFLLFNEIYFIEYVWFEDEALKRYWNAKNKKIQKKD